MYHHHAQHHHGNSHRHGWGREAARWAGVWPEPKVNCAAREVQSGKAWGDVYFPPLLIHPPGCQPIIAKVQGTVAKCWKCASLKNSHGLKRFIGSACGLPESAAIHELSSKAKTSHDFTTPCPALKDTWGKTSRETSNLFLSSDGSFFHGVPLCWLLPPA